MRLCRTEIRIPEAERRSEYGAALTFVVSVKKWVEQGGEGFERAQVERARQLEGPSGSGQGEGKT